MSKYNDEQNLLISRQEYEKKDKKHTVGSDLEITYKNEKIVIGKEKKKKLKTWHITLIVIASIILLIMLPYLSMQIEMQMVVRSREVRELIEEYIKREDPKAFTEEGVIKSYKIDYGSVYHNPMGGVEVEVYMNKDKELYVGFTIGKKNGELVRESFSISYKLNKLLQGED